MQKEEYTLYQFIVHSIFRLICFKVEKKKKTLCLLRLRRFGRILTVIQMGCLIYIMKRYRSLRERGEGGEREREGNE